MKRFYTRSKAAFFIFFCLGTAVSLSAQFTQRGSKLVGTGNIGAAYQGQAVALSSDGNTALVSGYFDNSGQGAVWVYTRSGTTWTQQGSKLVGTGNTGAALQGASVALSSDGNTALVGGYNDNSQQGAVWVFTRSGTTWTQQGSKLVGTGNTGKAYQGASVALSSDGNTALVGGFADNTDKGAAWVFTRSGTTWTQQGSKLVGTGSIGAVYQGQAVALSSDGNTALVGSSNDNSNQGAVWVYTRSGTTWTQQGTKLVGTGNTGAASHGISVALSSDGNTALIGGCADNTNRGAVWVWTRSGTTWTQQGSKLVGTGSTGAIIYQGISVDLSSDGNTALVGGANDNTNVGAVWVFTRSGTTWTQQGSKLVGTGSTGATIHQGTSVALSGDGDWALVGARADNSNQGAAWFFANSSVLPVELVSFSGKNTEGGNLLTWQTASEVNNKGFQIERSPQPPKGAFQTWETIGFKTANNKASTYEFTDATPPLGVGGLYYRLRQIDNDGTETLSKVISIATKGKDKGLKVYPNPVSNTLTVENTDLSRDNREGANFQILNLLGQQVLTGKTPFGGRGLDVSALPQGTYFLKVGTEQAKFIKQ